MITAIVSGVDRAQFDMFLDMAAKASIAMPIYIGSEYEVTIELYDSETDETLKGAKALSRMVALRLETMEQSNRAMEKSGEQAEEPSTYVR